MHTEFVSYKDIDNPRSLAYLIKSMPVGGAILHLGAHPDDEDVGLLSYLSHKYGVRAVYWSATRGEGGQNRINGYQNEALGVLRTWESLAARAIDGGECLFGPFFDFGFCKNAEKAFSNWNQERVVLEIVRAIRQVQPQIVIARWKGGPEDGHGQHQAIGIASRQAFELAGQPGRFPELDAEGLPAWQPRKYYCSTLGDAQPGEDFDSGRRLVPMERPGVLRLNTGEFDPIDGQSYQENAWRAFNQHKSQGLGMVPLPGDFFCYLTLEANLTANSSPKFETDIFDGLDFHLTGLADYPGENLPFLRQQLEEVQNLAEEAGALYRVENPLTTVPPVLTGLTRLRNLYEQLSEEAGNDVAGKALLQYLITKIERFEEVAVRCLGLSLEGFNDRNRLIPGMAFQVHATLVNQLDIPLQEKEIQFSLQAPNEWKIQELEPVQVELNPGRFSASFEIITGLETALSSPYWLARPRKGAVYQWPQANWVGSPFQVPSLQLLCRVKVDKTFLTLRKAVTGREVIASGYRRVPPLIIPPISLIPETGQEFLQAQPGSQTLNLRVAARNNSERAVQGYLTLQGPPEWRIQPEQLEIQLTEPGEVANFLFTVSLPPDCQAGHYPLNYTVNCEGRDYNLILKPVYLAPTGISSRVDSGNCLKEEIILEPAQVMVHLINARFVQGLNYAYVQGLQEELVATLKPFGVNFRLLSDVDLIALNLKEFDAIVIGPNAYMVRDQLRQNNRRFLDYVREGGTLIVQYQGYGYENENFTPYPFKFNHPHDRVTYEDAPVTILRPDFMFFRLPNAITETDFEGWIRDRGLYFFGEWDKRYQTFLASSDPGVSLHLGGLMGAYYGRGTYLYCGYSFFRQLPAGVIGAFRQFANILALPAARILERIDFLKKIYLFSTLTEEQLDPISRLVEERWFEDGTYICHKGDPANELYIIYRGAVEILADEENPSSRLALRRAGEWVGELAFLGEIPRTASMRAIGDVELLVLKGDNFVKVLYEYPDMGIRLSKMLVKSYFDLNTREKLEDKNSIV
ncbi:MAG TPA: cyclic nucleotide-binding domain-containing protein [Chloroflexia bacterium]|nr:cyclic nucleotide-binding domain-containing protein [Chloroflexia bacterium]